MNHLNRFLRKTMCLAVTATLTLSAVPAMTAPVFADETTQTSNATFNDNDYTVLSNMIAAVENSGVYGTKIYSAYKGAEMGAETTITLGWCSCYGNNARQLLQNIKDANPTFFAQTDADGTLNDMLTQDWEKTAWIPKDYQKNEIITLISSDTGKQCQDQFFNQMAETLVTYCQRNFTTNPGAIMMYCELGMLGWTDEADRIFNRVEDDYNGYFSMDCIMAALKDDQENHKTNGTPVSSSIYDNRHKNFYNWIKQYIPSEAIWGMSANSSESYTSYESQKSSTHGKSVLFTDVQDPDAYYYQPVYWALKNDITSGTTKTTFSPTHTCTRAQIITFLYNLYGDGEIDPDAGFKDVKPKDYYYKAVNWARWYDITAGKVGGSFSPNTTCTRAEIVTLIYRCVVGTNSKTHYSQSFSDVASDAYYSDAVGWALSKNITSGTDKTHFSPSGNCTRAQAVTLLYRADNAD